jgi:hypothetical protein
MTAFMFHLLKFKHIRHYAKSLLFISLLANFHIITLAQLTPTSAEDRMKAVQQRKELEKRSVVNDISFRNIGPCNNERKS